MNPWKLEEEMLLLGLGERVAAAIVREARDPVLFIEMRAKGFTERIPSQHRGMFLLETMDA